MTIGCSMNLMGTKTKIAEIDKITWLTFKLLEPFVWFNRRTPKFNDETELFFRKMKFDEDILFSLICCAASEALNQTPQPYVDTDIVTIEIENLNLMLEYLVANEGSEQQLHDIHISIFASIYQWIFGCSVEKDVVFKYFKENTDIQCLKGSKLRFLKRKRGETKPSRFMGQEKVIERLNVNQLFASVVRDGIKTTDDVNLFLNNPLQNHPMSEYTYKKYFAATMSSTKEDKMTESV